MVIVKDQSRALEIQVLLVLAPLSKVIMPKEGALITLIG
jgi:hypothetical protein